MTPDEYLLWGRLIDLLLFDGVIREQAIQWASPVPYYGDPSTAEVATMSLRPSHSEFINRNLYEILGQKRRFHTLRSLHLHSWHSVAAAHINRMDHLCRRYFLRNPSGLWHDRFGKVLQHTGRSYEAGTACHLSLIPYAMPQNGNRAMSDRKVKAMMDASLFALAQILRDSPIALLVLNGDAVIARFEWLADIRLSETEQPEWRLSNPQARKNEGFSYTGVLSSIGQVDLGREITIAGFNHSAISRYMDAPVRNTIARWVGEVATIVR